jgi:beta-N-acetylhexosaminidase
VIDLGASPFFLDDEAKLWVRRTIDALTLEQKIGQLFITMNGSFEPAQLDEVLDGAQVGGIRFRNGPAAEVREHIRYAQSRSAVPLLVASNPEMGGFGSTSDGTLVATHLQAGSDVDGTSAYELGRIAGIETAAVGCNWAFAPVVDIHLNWRNTVVGSRSFGNDPDLVIERSRRYLEGLRESGVAAAIKHFPGDGVDERDQHVVTTYNTLDPAAWRASYGRVYRALIEDGVPSIMVGHIGAPALSREFRPGLTDREILPATLAPELIGDLLRGELGFNGVVLTDSSIMAGMTTALPRAELVPAAIAAGCDMFLFFRNREEDIGYMLDGYRRGVITPERLDAALQRILGLKASLGLHRAGAVLVPPVEALEAVGSAEHHAVAARVADRTVTLVKDTAGNLPLTPATHRRIRLYGLTAGRDFTGGDPGAAVEIAREELERAGFEVHVFRDAAQRAASGAPPVPFHLLMAEEANAGYAQTYDAAIVVANVSGFAQEATVRIRWSSPFAAEVPWYATEVPTVFVSLNLPNHLIDVPMIPTVVHAYAPSREAIAAAVAKITGASPFTGTFNENVWCGTWETRR